MWGVGRQRRSFLSPPGRRFLFAFTDPVAVAFDFGYIGMVQQAVQQRYDAGGVGKHFVPLFEGSIGRQNHGLLFVATVDHLIEQVGRPVTERISILFRTGSGDEA